jgi:transcriptional regulator with XRE-family HTH domain
LARQDPRRTLSRSQGSEQPARQALITGSVLRLARESSTSICSQERLAELLGISVDTEAGWESGRRPLAAAKVAQVLLLKATLIRIGAAPDLVRLMDVAMEADQILDHARCRADRHRRGDFHPLGAYVHRREVIELVAWPLSSRKPQTIPAGSGARRHGPVPAGPELSDGDRNQVYNHLRHVVEASQSEDNLLYRQALYLQSYDQREDAREWMAQQHRRLPRQRSGWSSQWPALRTLAASMVRYGDPSILIDFSEQGLADEAGHVANLNYWAYWVGESVGTQRDDSFMPVRLGAWRGAKIMRHLISRLDAAEGVADLGIHTLRTLLAARPRLLDEDPESLATLAESAERLLDAGKMSPTARQALVEINFALRLHTR